MYIYIYSYLAPVETSPGSERCGSLGGPFAGDQRLWDLQDLLG